MFRVGIAQLLRSAGGCEIVAEGAGLEDLFRLARQQAPDVMVADLHLAFCPDALRRFADEFPATRLLMLAVIADDDHVLAALQSGAAGYLRKGASGSELIWACARCIVADNMSMARSPCASCRERSPARRARIRRRS